jgi:hypothetical protein
MGDPKREKYDYALLEGKKWVFPPVAAHFNRIFSKPLGVEC